MVFRAILRSAVLLLLLCLNANAAPACEGGPCPAAKPSKPLDIMQFMREQAASTRAGAKPKRASPETRAAKRSSAATAKPVPSEAVTSFAAQPAPPLPQPAAPDVEIVTEDELNAVDRAGEAAPPETVGAAPPPMQIADVETTVVAKGEQPLPSMTAATEPPATSPAAEEQPSLLQRIWSAIRGTFAALAAATHHLFG